MIRHRLLILLLSVWALVPAWAQGTTPALAKDAEVAYLFSTLAQADCRFQRNGIWYSAPKAASHLQQKYDYLQKRGWAPTTELFIERAGTQSSITGKPYMVRCGNAAAVSSKSWLLEKLAAYRQARPSPGAAQQPGAAAR